MKRGEITTIEELIIGDRFYFQSDRKKEVYEVHEQKNKSYLFGVKSTWIFKPKSAYKIHVKRGRKVVFLKNIDELTNQELELKK